MKCPHKTSRVAYKSNPTMAAAWHNVIIFVASEKTIVSRFYREKKLDQSLSIADPKNFSIMEEFIDWVNVNVWGEDPFLY